MLCEHCKMREAEIGMAMMKNGQRRMVHLCRECADECMSGQDSGCVMKLSFTSSQLDDIDTLAKGIEDTFRKVILPALSSGKKRTYKHICPHCGHPLPDSMFEDKNKGECCEPEIEKTEKTEKTARSTAERIALYRKELDEAVKGEDYEKAAAIRDKIAELTAAGAGTAGAEDNQ